MAKNRSSKRPPGSYRHEHSSRVNQPTSETAALLSDDVRAPQPFEVELNSRNLRLEDARTDRRAEPQPRLAWERQGHTSNSEDSCGFAGVPLYTREKINPLTMIEQSRRGDVGVPLSLLDDFNGLPPDAKRWEFYQHSGHWQNRLIHGDSSEVMQSLIARDGLAGQVQMIYFDPPYGIGFKSNFMTATDRLETKDDATGVPVGDAPPIRAFRDTYERGIHSYLDGVHERLVLFRELLSESGSLFVQIGDENVHRLAVLCDEVFGHDNRMATITWKSTGGTSAKTLPESASYLLWYAKDRECVKYRQLYEPLDRSSLLDVWTWATLVELSDGTVRSLTSRERVNPDDYLPSDARLFRMQALTSQGASSTGRTCDYEYDGVTYHPGSTRQWCVSTPEERKRTNGIAARASGAAPPDGGDELCGLDRLAEIGRLHGSGESGQLHWKWYEDEVPGRRIDNVWSRPMSPRSKRYVVQVSDRAIERCILMTTDPGDLVLDPTCGSGVTAHMAEHWGRRWVTMDVSRVSIAIARRHLLTSTHPWFRTRDGGSDPSVGFEVETMQRVSAATLAYDTVNEPENTIELVDRPHEDKNRSRLTGPFTVESVSPYSYLPFSDSSSTQQFDAGAVFSEHAERLLEALVSQPIRDADGREVLRVVETIPWPEGRRISHEADCTIPNREAHYPAAIMLAAPDITVTADHIAAAAAEARSSRRDIADLIIVAAAFEDAASTTIGTLRVHKVMASRDLQIPGLSKDADAGALTLLGEPDVTCSHDGTGNLVVTLEGYDTFDPSTGRVRASEGTRDIDCWMIDTDHDGTGFFPRLVYLPAYKRGDRQIKNLFKALGKDLDPQAEIALCGVKSQAFLPPSPGNNIGVKIITRTGTEMTTYLSAP